MKREDSTSGGTPVNLKILINFSLEQSTIYSGENLAQYLLTLSHESTLSASLAYVAVINSLEPDMTFRLSGFLGISSDCLKEDFLFRQKVKVVL